MALAENKQAEIYAQLLGRLSGVYAANVTLDESGEVAEVHLLTSTTRSPKQVVRDARSALITLHGLDVDHRKFSVAQLRDAFAEELAQDDVPTPCKGIRLQCGQIVQTLSDERYALRCTLKYEGRTFEGYAIGGNTANQRIRTEAEAVLAAIHQYLGRDKVFLLLTAQKINTSPAPVILVLLECLADHHTSMLVGAAEATDNQALSVMRATLDALNRKLSVLKVPEGDEPAR